MLDNESYSIEQSAHGDSGRLWIAGLGDVFFGREDLGRTMQRVPPGEPVIMLVHEPDYADTVAAYRKHVDLQLSGHSHGGQVRVPGVGAIPMVLPQWAHKYIMGHFRIGKMQLYTNRGLGTVGVPVRFNCPPEVTRITLRSAAVLTL
jgi:predicted MPP superfamily phosphohydrolase